ncbi:Chaperone protein DnaJ [Lasiodiplodia hormozganensis]|uniref:Chaperone protein DnaJ n=1 Tax=Lasiodiplodia hormozganensis TaxID=869390 RepID=A0AA39YM22_9PEZI|nr:Chaperone protein DnaJ [Lasiodiplodia hormozganensis]
MPRLALSPRTPHQLLAARRRQQCSNTTSTRQFHASTCQHNNAEAQSHYEALELPFTASAAEIKRQFYSLSKRHHPDRNKGDPAASSRFVRISEAYHVLGSPEKRSRYDRDLARLHPNRHHGHHHASPSYAGPAGSRPPSGLSRRRTQFRGPPPSFYRNGAWGAHGAKRAAAGGFDGTNPHEHTTDHHNYAGESTSSATGGDNTYTGAFYASPGGGFGPGQAERGWDNAIPHWDRVAHRRTQEGIAAQLSRRARMRGESVEEMKNGGGPWSLLINFFVVSGAIAIVASIPSWMNYKKREKVPGK